MPRPCQLAHLHIVLAVTVMFAVAVAFAMRVCCARCRGGKRCDGGGSYRTSRPCSLRAAVPSLADSHQTGAWA
eukprot:10476051-Lingulodinium_polyedra.AAC.1